MRNKICLSVLILAVLLRLWHLGYQSLWVDEAYSWSFASSPVISLPQVLNDFCVHPPFYFLLLHIWMAITGLDTEIYLRLFSVLISLLSIFAVKLAAEELFDNKTAWFSVFLMALSVREIYHGQEVRMYPLMTFLGAISYWSLLKLTRTNNRKYWLIYFFSSLALVYTHVFGIFSIIGQTFFLIFSQNKSFLKKWACCQGLIVLAWIPWGKIFLAQILAVERYSWIKNHSFPEFIAWTNYFGSSSLTIYLLVLSALGIYFTRQRSFHLLFLGIWVLSPVLIAFIVELLYQPILKPRYLIFSSVAFYIAAGHAISLLSDRRFFQTAAIGLFFILSIFALKRYYFQFQRPDWRAAFHFINQNTATDDQVLVVPNYLVSLATYYRRQGIRGFWNPDIGNYPTSDQIHELFKGQKRLWFSIGYGIPDYYTEPATMDFLQDVRSKLGTEYQIVSENDFNGVLVVAIEEAAINKLPIIQQF